MRNPARKTVDLSAKSLGHQRNLSRKQLEEIQANVYKRLGLNKNDKNAKVTGPPPKTGKRLYVGLTPYIVRGSRGAFKRELIASKKYTPEEFAAVQAERKARGVNGASDDKVVEQHGLTMREKLEQMTASYSDRLTFAKSNIHGWGLVAKVFHKAGSIVTQFKGETCRSTVADLRETFYEDNGGDCYLLKQDDDTVVDCTFQGNVCAIHQSQLQPEHVLKNRQSRRRESHHLFRSNRRSARGRADVQLQIRKRRRQSAVLLRRRQLSRLLVLNATHS